MHIFLCTDTPLRLCLFLICFHEYINVIYQNLNFSEPEIYYFFKNFQPKSSLFLKYFFKKYILLSIEPSSTKNFIAYFTFHPDQLLIIGTNLSLKNPFKGFLIIKKELYCLRLDISQDKLDIISMI